RSRRLSALKETLSIASGNSGKVRTVSPEVASDSVTTRPIPHEARYLPSGLQAMLPGSPPANGRTCLPVAASRILNAAARFLPSGLKASPQTMSKSIFSSLDSPKGGETPPKSFLPLAVSQALTPALHEARLLPSGLKASASAGKLKTFSL